MTLLQLPSFHSLGRYYLLYSCLILMLFCCRPLREFDIGEYVNFNNAPEAINKIAKFISKKYFREKNFIIVDEVPIFSQNTRFQDSQGDFSNLGLNLINVNLMVAVAPNAKMSNWNTRMDPIKVTPPTSSSFYSRQLKINQRNACNIR